jgi:SulP family sulfate permease
MTSIAAWAVRTPKPAFNDVAAGVTVALVLVPQSIAYAQLAGTPPGAGLIAATTAAFVGAATTTSPYLQAGPTALSSLLTFAVVADAGTAAEALHRAMLLAMLIGAIRVVLAAARAGALSYLVSEPILTGVLPGAAIVIAASQVPALVGFEPRSASVFGAAGDAFEHPSAWSASAAVAGAFALGAFTVQRSVPRLPLAALAVAVFVVVQRATGLGGPTVGAVDTPVVPPLGSLPWDRFGSLLLPALVIAVVGFIEPTIVGRSLGAAETGRWNADRELLSSGLTNLAAGAAGGFPVGASLSRSALNRALGARTRWSSAMTAVTVAAFLPFAEVLAPLPRSVPAALVVVSVIGLADPRPLVHLLRSSRIQTGVATAGLVLTIALTPRLDLAVGGTIALAIAVHLWLETRVPLTVERDGDRLTLRPAGVLWFASAYRFEEAANAAIDSHSGHDLVLRLDALGRIDVTGARAILRCAEKARSAGMTVAIEGVPAPAAPLMSRLLHDVVEMSGDDGPLSR